MSMRSWIRNLFARPATRPIRKAPHRFRPALEVLEDRAVPATFTVLNNFDDGSVGSLRWAVGQANTNTGPDTINFGDGSASGGTNFLDANPHTITLSGTKLTLTDSATTTITGPGANLLSISGNDLSQAFLINPGASAALSDLTITGGKATAIGINGGGLSNGGTLTMTNCTLSGNSCSGQSSQGGGLSNGGTATLTDCTFSGNTVTGVSTDGGGLFNGGTLTMTNCTFSGNTSPDGGGMANRQRATLTDCTFTDNSGGNGGGGLANLGNGNNINSVTLTGCTFTGNTASTSAGSGGGLNNQRTGATLIGCTFTDNSASTSGGGVYTAGATALFTLTDCTLSGNSAGNSGGGLFNASGAATLTNCTISGNTAVSGGGLIQSLGNSHPTTLGNTIVAGNTAANGPDVFNNFVSQGNNLIGQTDSSTGWIVSGVNADLTGTSAMPLDPMLAPLGNYGDPTQTMALLPGSPAIGAGNTALIPAGVTTDQRGDPRTVNGAVDIGAFELQAPTFSALASPTIVYGTSSTTLTGHLGAATAYPTGASVSITLNSVPQTATVDGSGNFTTTFDTATLGVAAGPYTVTYAFAGSTGFLGAANDTNTTLTVTTATLTLTASAQSSVYGTTPSVDQTQYSVAGLVNGDQLTTVPTLTLTGVTAASHVNTYTGAITANGAAASTDYTISYVAGNWSVTQPSVVSLTGDVYVLNQTASGALTVSGNAQLNVAGTLQVDSNSASAVVLSGNAGVNAAQTLIVGGDQVSGHADFDSTVMTHAADVTDPLAVLAAQAGSSAVAVNLSDGQTHTLTPGVYASITVSGNTKLILTSGIYIIGSGGITVSGNASVTSGGQGVLIYNNGALTVSGNASVNLTAYSTGDYAGLAIFQARTDASAVTVSGNANVNLNGSVLYDANVQSVVTLSGNAKVDAALVVNELTISGNSDDAAP